MLTPRRTLLLLTGFVLFFGAYAVYARVLGWLDGLPQLPDHMLAPGPGEFRPPLRLTSPTQQKLAEAFGEKSPELETVFYPTQLEFRNGESSCVLAAGRPPNNPNSKRVTLTPFSLAIFSKPKPPHLRQPGEVVEISTIHADKGIIEFDRVINNPSDMNKAKLVRLELVSDPDPERTPPDPRRGKVHITNNQRSSDPNRHLVLRTPGPVFYRDAKAVAGTPAAQGPDFWTDAEVEIVDRQNLPRPFGSGAPATAPSKGEDTRNTAAVNEIITGQRLPPPTVTAIGLRVYLEPDPPQGQKRPQRPGSTGVTGVRRVEFLEQVLMNLWVDNGQSLVGGSEAPKADAPKSGSPLALTPPPPAIIAVTGGLGPGGYTAKLMNRALLQIDTRGPFAYDAEKNTARFDVVPRSDPNLPNDVQVTKVPTRAGTSSLFSKVLELEFNGGLVGGSRPPGTPAIKKLHAWAYAPGHLTIASQEEAMEAYGQDLVHEQGANRTVLTGAPLYVFQKRNALTAGGPQRPATLTSEPALAIAGGVSPPLAKAEARKQQVTVRGAGDIKLFDSASNATTLTATWQTSLVQTKETFNGREQDLFTFTDGAKFEDVKADYWLKGNVLKLWLEPRAEKPGAAEGKNGQPRPARIQALGQVSSHSTEYDIEQADQLTAHFEDPKADAVAAGPRMPVSPGAPPAAVAVAPLPGPMPPGPKLPNPLAAVPKEPAKPKPVTKISAKTIETWVTRVPVKPSEGKPPEPGKPADQPAAVKYQLDRARCEDNVTVHQDPIDPSKPRGTDITGRLLVVDGSADGSVLTVFGWPDKLGEVHQEGMSLVGPEVILNQVLNSAEVKGRGALTMPTKSDLAGTELAQPEVVVIHWRDSMRFNGGTKSATFEGKVLATQGESWVLCHTMNVTFDRPMYFNPAQKKAAAERKDPLAKETAKIDTVHCYPAAADSADDKRELLVTYNQVEFDKTGKKIKTQLLRVQALKMEAQAQDPEGGEKYQRVGADGPGELRIWQLGDKDIAGPAPKNNPPPKGPMQPGAKPAATEQEMKLTIVTFSGRMTAIDKGKVFQQATFKDNVQAISLPAENESVQVERHKLPPRAVLLTCTRELVVSSHKKGNASPVQRMDASGNSYLRSDEYDGWGERITNDGNLVILYGSDAIPARIMNRFNQGNDQSGKTIKYDRATGSYGVIDGFGGTIGSPPKK